MCRKCLLFIYSDNIIKKINNIIILNQLKVQFYKKLSVKTTFIDISNTFFNQSVFLTALGQVGLQTLNIRDEIYFIFDRLLKFVVIIHPILIKKCRDRFIYADRNVYFEDIWK